MAGREDGRGRPPPVPPRGRGSPPIGRARPPGRPPVPPRQPGARPGVPSFSSSEDYTQYISSSSSSSGPTPPFRGGMRPRAPIPGMQDPDITTLSQRMAEVETSAGAETTITSSGPTPTSGGSGEALSLPTQSVSQTDLPTETIPDTPKFYRGESGKELDLACNYLKLIIDEEMGVFQYEVKFNPRVDSREERFRLLNQQRERFDGGIKVFDGAALYVRKKLAGGDRTVISTNERNEQCQLTFSFKRQCKAGDPNVVQLYNVLFGRIFRTLKFSQHKRKYYDSQGAYAIREHNINVWPGYITAVDQYEGGLLLQLDISHRVLRTETVRDLLLSLRRKKRARLQGRSGKAVVRC